MKPVLFPLGLILGVALLGLPLPDDALAADAHDSGPAAPARARSRATADERPEKRDSDPRLTFLQSLEKAFGKEYSEEALAARFSKPEDAVPRDFEGARRDLERTLMLLSRPRLQKDLSKEGESTRRAILESARRAEKILDAKAARYNQWVKQNPEKAERLAREWLKVERRRMETERSAAKVMGTPLPAEGRKPLTETTARLADALGAVDMMKGGLTRDERSLLLSVDEKSNAKAREGVMKKVTDRFRKEQREQADREAREPRIGPAPKNPIPPLAPWEWEDKFPLIRNRGLAEGLRFNSARRGEAELRALEMEMARELDID